MTYRLILTREQDRVGIIQLNRPKVLNALNQEIMEEVVDALEAFDGRENIAVVVLTGNKRVFAAGADISEMTTATTVSMLNSSFTGLWDRIGLIKKPIIAAVSGFALGGGCELAMACDMIIASESAKFGQPEINIGVIPGAGGTQRLTRAIGKALAMEMVLNGRYLSADEALQHGLVNRIVPVDTYLEETLSFAAEIAGRAPVALRLGKEAINAAFEMNLQSGLTFEKRLFNILFATEDQSEGMDAFMNKRPAKWLGK